MAGKEITVVFQHGLNQGVSKRVLPEGWFTAAENVRIRKGGYFGKRRGMFSRGAALITGGSTSETPQFIGQLGGADLLCERGIVWSYDAATWTAPLEGSEPLSVVSDFEPTKREPVAIDEFANSHETSVGYINGYRFVAWRSTNGLYVRCENDATGALVFLERLDGGGTAVEPRLVGESSGSKRMVCVWRDGTTIKMKYCNTSPAPPTGFGSSSNLATGVTAAAGFDITASESSAGFWHLVYQSAASQITIARCSSAGVNTSANFTDVATTLQAGVFYGPADVGQIVYVAWRQVGGGGAGAIGVKAYKENLTSPTASLSYLDMTTTNDSRPVGIGSVSTGTGGKAWVCWSGTVSSQRRLYVRQVTYSSGAASVTSSGSLTTLYEFAVASKPRYISTADDGGIGSEGLFLWAWGGRASTLQSGFYLLEPLWVNGRAHMRVAPATAYSEDHPGPWLATDSSEYWWSYPEAFRGLISGTPAVGSTTFRFTHTDQRPHRATAQLGGSLYVAGGYLAQYDGRTVSESGYNWAPVITSLAESTGGGSLTLLATYYYVTWYEWVDTAGNRHQGAPSAVASITLTGVNNQVTVTAMGLDAATLRYSSSDQIASVVGHVARTTSTGRILHRVTPDTGAPIVVKQSGGLWSYTDGMADATAAGTEELYTQGGVLPNASAPPCGHVWAGNGRLCVSRLPDRSLVQWSKIHVPSEPVLWADSNAFRARVPGDVECVGEMDGVWYIFTADAIWGVVGDGPDDKGAGAFQEPVRVPGRGCTDWRSLLRVPEGLLYRSTDGIYMLPRGGGAATWVGEAVQDLLTSDIIGAVWDPTDNCAVLGLADKALVLDLPTGEWTSDAYATAPATYGLWNDQLAYASSTGALFTMSTGDWVDGSTTGVDQTLTTGEVTLFGIDGFGRVRKVYILGEFRSAATLNVYAYIDGDSTPYSTSFSLPAADYTPGDRFELQWDLPVQKMTSLQLKFVDTDPAVGSAGEGLALHGITLAGVEKKVGGAKRPAGSRA